MALVIADRTHHAMLLAGPGSIKAPAILEALLEDADDLVLTSQAGASQRRQDGTAGATFSWRR
jgi:hypothetical protein